MASTSQPAMATADVYTYITPTPTSRPPSKTKASLSGSGHGDEQVQRQATWPEEADGGSQPLVMPEDGYQWKKYGQKFIKNIQKIRSYFRCRDRRCGAKKKVEWQPGDPSLRVVYDGAHQHGSPSSSSSHGGGGGQDGDGNRYELSAQYFGGGAPTPQAR